MRIGFYLHHSTIKAGGIFTYSIGILKLLLNTKEIEKIILIYSPEIRQSIIETLNNPKIEPLEIDRSQWSIKLRLMISYFFHDMYLIIKNYLPESKKISFLKSLSFIINPYKSKINRTNISLLHIPMQYSPVYSLNVPIITTMHDLQGFHYPEYFSPQERIHRAINNKKSLDEAKHVIVSFDHIKKDLIKYFNLNEEKVSVCPPPFSENWFTGNTFTDSEIVKKKYSLPDEFILYPAATWVHKNHLNLIKALYQLESEGRTVHLVCTGNKTEYFEAVLEKEINRLKLYNQVKFLGIIPEGDLISLYKLTSLVVIPTRYEAGSAPLYEAMRYGAAVICSKVTSLPDTIADDEFLFDPEEVYSIAQLIEKMLSDKTLSERNIKNSKQRIAELAGINYSSNFLNVYRKVINSRE